MRIFGFVILLIVIVGAATGVYSYRGWKRDAMARLVEGSEVIETAKGPVEMVRKGSGPVVLVFHGGPGGYDQGALIGGGVLLRSGFTVIGVSRPGYLRTPLASGRTEQEQADLMIALMDELHIEKAAAVGFSAGAPVAFEMAQRHPKRMSAVVLQSIGSVVKKFEDYKIADAPLSKFVLSGAFGDLGSWVLSLQTKYMPQTVAHLLLTEDTFLQGEALKLRLQAATENPDQMSFLTRLIATLIPFSLRKAGLTNDLVNLDPWPHFDYSTFKTPALIIQAKEDALGSYTEALVIASKIPNASFIAVDDSGHLIWMGPHTTAWEEKMVTFLKEHAS